ncbi:NUDIX hydrolase [Zeaxanthinibacter sp. PT1]|uniref:NUDIX hydrolase n=1 Tax=Zeaxanthinibacter TaxID=561554 RepID=UPI00234B32A1|nr:NUDIX hydrolase [Zeaxanthinibacter sp. PT1]MDC6352383.1 NUDIX hydrolase [Zeaxanthinibacter sp. PT1]
MILKKLIHRPDRKVHPLIGLLLFSISVILMVITGPFGFLFGIFHSLFYKGIKGLGEYLLQVAISIDQLGNVLMQHLLNVLWIRRGGYPFGNRDETISSALGRNKELSRLTVFGRAIDRLLDLIDPNHSLNSIDYYIEPSPGTVDRLVWIHIRQGKLLTLRFKDHEELDLPGGRRIPSSSDAANLKNLLELELGVEPIMNSLTYFHTFEDALYEMGSGTTLRQTCYTADYKGEIQPHPSVQSVIWLGKEELEKLSVSGQVIGHFLVSQGLLT